MATISLKMPPVLRQLGRKPVATISRSSPAISHLRRSSQQNVPGQHERLERLAARLPKGTWDTHMHVVDARKYPLAADAQYQPASPHTIDDAQTFLSGLGISKMVIVQPSIYGNDNSCTLDGLRRLGVANGRAVVQFDVDATSPAQLREWHDLGVRGVRLNFKSVGARLEGGSLAAALHKYADAVGPLGWALELYIGMEDMQLLEPLVPDLGGAVKMCIDHFGHPSRTSLETAQSVDVLPGFASLANLLRMDNVWVKCSASYRLHPDPKHPLVTSLCRQLLKLRPDRCVFATDWPHTRFEEVDVTSHVEAILDCCEQEGVPLEQICVSNAAELFDAE